MAAAALTALRKRLSRRLAGEVGGPRRLHALVTAAAASLLAPHAAWSYLRAGAAERAAWLGGGAVLCAAGALALCGLVLNCVHPNPDPNPNPHPHPDPDPVQVLNYHVDAAMQARLTPADAASLGLALSLGAAAGLERLYSARSNPNPSPNPNPNPNPNPSPSPNPNPNLTQAQEGQEGEVGAGGRQLSPQGGRVSVGWGALSRTVDDVAGTVQH